MGNHSMRLKKPGNVMSVGPIWLSKATGQNRKERRAAFKKLRANLGSRTWHARIKEYALNQQLAWFKGIGGVSGVLKHDHRMRKQVAHA